VIQGDVGEHLHRGAEDVRRVEPPAEPRLDDGDVHLRLGEGGERGRRQHLELRRPKPLPGRPDALDGGLEVDGRAVDVDALAPAGDVRRRVGARPQPGAGHQRAGHPRRRRLPVRADDVNRRVAALRVAEVTQQRLHSLQSELLRPRRERGDPRGRAIR
jgi:hypothetical protein